MRMKAIGKFAGRHIGRLKKALRKLLRSDNSRLVRTLERVLVLSPGAFLILAGMAVLLAPQLTLFLTSVFLIMLGAALSLLGWKLLKLRRRLSEIARQFEARIYIQGAALKEAQPEFGEREIKKVVYH